MIHLQCLKGVETEDMQNGVIMNSVDPLSSKKSI